MKAKNYTDKPFLYLCSTIRITPSKSDILNLCRVIREQSKEINASNEGGWHSTYMLHRSENDFTKGLSLEILEFASYLLKKNALIEKDQNLAYTQFWININQKYDWNRPHTHKANSNKGLEDPSWSGVYYVNVEGEEAHQSEDDLGGDILFFTHDKLGRVTYRTHRPRNGQLLLFRSDLLHMVTPNKEKYKRVSVAFNLKEEN